MVLCVMVVVLFLDRGTGSADGDDGRTPAPAERLMVSSIERLSTRVDDLGDRLGDLRMVVAQLQVSAGTGGRPAGAGDADPDPNPRDPSVEGGDPPEIQPPSDPTLEALTSPRAADRWAAVVTLHQNFRYDAIPELQRLAASDPDPYVRSFAIKALGAFRATEATALLERIAAREAGTIVGNSATEALALLRGNR